MKSKNEFYIGLDVHKRTTTYAVRDWNGSIAAEGSCASRAEDLKALLKPFLQSCIIGMECNTSNSHFDLILNSIWFMFI